MIPLTIQPVATAKPAGTIPVLASAGSNVQTGTQGSTGAFADILASSSGKQAQHQAQVPVEGEAAAPADEADAATPTGQLAAATAIPEHVQLPSWPRNAFSGPASPQAATGLEVAPQDAETGADQEPAARVLDTAQQTPPQVLQRATAPLQAPDQQMTPQVPVTSASQAGQIGEPAEPRTALIQTAVQAIPVATPAVQEAIQQRQVQSQPATAAHPSPAPVLSAPVAQPAPAMQAVPAQAPTQVPTQPTSQPTAAVNPDRQGSAASPVAAPVAGQVVPTVPAVAPSPVPAQPPQVRAWTVQQLTGPVTRIAGQTAALPGGGTSTIVRISPEALGPVTIEATNRDGVIRLEVTAATEAGRENLRMVLGELRRDLAASQPGATLDMGAGKDGAKERDMNGAEQRQDGREGAGRDKGSDTGSGAPRSLPAEPSEPASTTPGGYPRAGLDVLA